MRASPTSRGGLGHPRTCRNLLGKLRSFLLITRKGRDRSLLAWAATGLIPRRRRWGALFLRTDPSFQPVWHPAEQQCGQDRHHGNADDHWHVSSFARCHFGLLWLYSLWAPIPRRNGVAPGSHGGKGKAGVEPGATLAARGSDAPRPWLVPGRFRNLNKC